MDSSVPRRPGAFSALPTTPTTPTPTAPFAQQQQQQQHHQRSPSPESDSSSSSHVTAMSSNNRRAYPQRPPLVHTGSSTNSSTTSLHNFSRPSIAQVVNDAPSRKQSPLNPGNDPRSHKRNNSQGFFDPSVPTASHNDSAAMSGFSASQIAAQTAMQREGGNQHHSRKRSQTVPSPQDGTPSGINRSKPPPLPVMQTNSGRRPSGAGLPLPQYPRSGTSSPTLQAASAASAASAAAYPGTPTLSPGFTSFAEQQPVEKETKQRSDRKLKLFSSKPKSIGIPSYKDGKDSRAMPSPGKITTPPSIMSVKMNASTTSLADSISTVGTGTIYGMANASTSTLVPTQKGEEKEKHKHHFLSRQRNKLRDKIDDHSSLYLSSANSNSKPTDPHAPNSLYNFTPTSPGLPQNAFSKSTTGFDLRHGGRALREKKREEKAAAVMPDSKREREDWPFGPPSGGSATGLPTGTGPDFGSGNLQGFGLHNMTSDEAWAFLKAKLLIIFENEELRMPVEDMNRLVSVHIQRCVQKKAPSIIVEDLDDLLRAGFSSLDHQLRQIREDKLVPNLVEMWLFVFGTVLPYIQAVFLPLDLEFRGSGSIMATQQAAEFWGVRQDRMNPNPDLDVRRFVLLSYRDNILLPRHDNLKAIFSRLSLDSITKGLESPLPLPSPSAFGEPKRPGTSGSLDPSQASFNSQGSTLLGDGGRSRATSNTSAPELPPFSPSHQKKTEQLDSSKVTEMIGRMLQCMSVLCSLKSDDEAQEKMESLTKALKLNWLGRGRTGRNRKGFVGARVPKRVVNVH